MPALTKPEAAEKLAKAVEKARPAVLAEINAELFPEQPTLISAVASDTAQHIREGLEAEEIVDLWNVVFPEDRHVWYDEEARMIRFNEEAIEYAD